MRKGRNQYGARLSSLDIAFPINSVKVDWATRVEMDFPSMNVKKKEAPYLLQQTRGGKGLWFPADRPTGGACCFEKGRASAGVPGPVIEALPGDWRPLGSLRNEV